MWLKKILIIISNQLFYNYIDREKQKIEQTSLISDLSNQINTNRLIVIKILYSAELDETMKGDLDHIFSFHNVQQNQL